MCPGPQYLDYIEGQLDRWSCNDCYLYHRCHLEQLIPQWTWLNVAIAAYIEASRLHLLLDRSWFRGPDESGFPTTPQNDVHGDSFNLFCSVTTLGFYFHDIWLHIILFAVLEVPAEIRCCCYMWIKNNSLRHMLYISIKTILPKIIVWLFATETCVKTCIINKLVCKFDATENRFSLLCMYNINWS